MLSVYLVRHAIAGERRKGKDDTRRSLTRRGRTRMKAATAGFRRLEPGIDVILTSPLVRARQTADILSAGLPGSPDVEECEALSPGRAPREMAGAFAGRKRAKAIALVGHEPDLGVLAAWLIGARAPLPFRKGGIARIDLAHPPQSQRGTLVWLATPKMLRGR